jgi:nickel-dependent lactate racemase
LEEAAGRVGIDFILNVIVDGAHRIVGAVAGDARQAHSRGCEIVAHRGKMSISQLADIVLVSAGGHPTDVNLYQAQKALDNAPFAVRDGGVIILAAECPEGLGNRTFEHWMTSAGSPQEILDRIQRDFVLGGHKAAAIARVATRAHIILVSPALARVPLPGIEHCPTVQAALETALAMMGQSASITVMPRGGSVLPQVQ